ncbi:hypothetical protein M569_06392 [Genlisea aurea]|uniref:DC1 domain-containing protein n=1 Tax=Genlisea aurea TaxID=192259 RepID=S8CMK4_9LAMI|nr:hypothetical protein M569_06392 [Genlisea aurea]
MKYTEISHFAHPQHNLKYDYSEAPFKCDGCKEAGIGSRYKCSGGGGGGGGGGGYYYACNFDLHTHCAMPSPSVTHPFYTRCSFQFMSRPPGEAARYCNACEKDVAGFVYHCRSCGFDLHPCCAKLPMVLVDDGEVKLYLYKKLAAPFSGNFPSHRCGRKGRSWCYRSSCHSYNFHVACVKEMLVENWHEIYRHTGGGGGGGNARKLETQIPNLKESFHSLPNNRRHSRGKACEIAASAFQFVTSAVLGDPTALIVAAVAALIK